MNITDLDWTVVNPDQLIDERFERLPLGLKSRSEVAPSLEEFELTGLILLRDLDRLRWQLGDWAALLAKSHGQEAYQKLAAHLMSDRLARTVEDWAYTCRNVPYEIRREDLSFYHHRTVAPLGDTQAYWLERAAREKWTVRQLREAIAQTNGEPPPPRIEDRLFEYEQRNAELHRQIDNLAQERDTALERSRRLENRVNRLEQACDLLRKALENVPKGWGGFPLIREALKLLENEEE